MHAGGPVASGPRGPSQREIEWRPSELLRVLTDTVQSERDRTDDQNLILLWYFTVSHSTPSPNALLPLFLNPPLVELDQQSN